jgi:hypothetical protein
MNLRTFLLLDVLLLFLGYSLWVIAGIGYVGFFREALSSPVGIQLVADILIACTLGLLWMRGDARQSGVPFAPYLALTLVLGSVGLLGYLLHRELRARGTAPVRSAATA